MALFYPHLWLFHLQSVIRRSLVREERDEDCRVQGDLSQDDGIPRGHFEEGQKKGEYKMGIKLGLKCDLNGIQIGFY